jgi:hypothetical protein
LINSRTTHYDRVQTCLFCQPFPGAVTAAYLTKGLVFVSRRGVNALACTCRQPIIHAQHQEFLSVV